MALQHTIRHIVAHTARKHARGELREDDKIMPGMAWRDAVCITVALVVVVSAALLVQHEFELDADVLYDVGAAIGAHPLSRGFRKILDAII